MTRQTPVHRQFRKASQEPWYSMDSFCRLFREASFLSISESAYPVYHGFMTCIIDDDPYHCMEFSALGSRNEDLDLELTHKWFLSGYEIYCIFAIDHHQFTNSTGTPRRLEIRISTRLPSIKSTKRRKGDRSTGE